MRRLLGRQGLLMILLMVILQSSIFYLSKGSLFSVYMFGSQPSFFLFDKSRSMESQSAPSQVFLFKSIDKKNALQEIIPIKKVAPLVPLVFSPRALHAKSLSPRKNTLPWSTILVSLASLFAFICCPQWLPLHYLHAASHRLLGWREGNLQYRFIHSR